MQQKDEPSTAVLCLRTWLGGQRMRARNCADSYTTGGGKEARVLPCSAWLVISGINMAWKLNINRLLKLEFKLSGAIPSHAMPMPCRAMPVILNKLSKLSLDRDAAFQQERLCRD